MAPVAVIVVLVALCRVELTTWTRGCRDVRPPNASTAKPVVVAAVG